MDRPSLLARLLALLPRRAPPPALPAPTNPFARRDSDEHLVPYDPWRRDDGWRVDGSIYNALTQLGGPDDKGAVGRPSPFVIPLDDWELTALWTNNGITQRIVAIVPQRATRRGWSVPELDSETERLQVPACVTAAATWARLYGAGVGLLVTEDDVRPGLRPDQVLMEPLDLQRVGRLDAIQVFDPIEAQPVAYETDIRSPRFRLPLYWRFSTPEFRAVVHASRVAHFRGTPRPPSQARSSRNGLPDDTCLQAIWDETRRLTETLQGGAVLAHEIRESVFKLKNLGAKRAGDRGATLEQRAGLIARTKALLGLIVLDPEDSYENRSNPPTGFSELSAAGWEALAAVTGIPQVILMGSTPGGLNTDGDSSWEGFRQLVSTYQAQHLRGPLKQIYSVAYAAQDGPTRGQTPDRWAVTFAPLDEPREDRIATTRAEVARMDETNIRAGIYTAEDVRHERFGAGGWSIDLGAIPDRPATETKQAAFAQVGLPALVAAGIVSPSAARRMLGVGEDAAPSAAELAALAAAAGGSDPRVDADDEPSPPPVPATPPALARGALVSAPVADLQLLDRVRQAIGQDLVVEQEPHVTVLYLGDLRDPAALAEVAATTAEEVRALAPGMSLRGAEVRAFPPGPKGTPIVVEFADSWRLASLHDVLLTRLAHLVTARQHRSYRAHVTLGYAPAPVGPDASAALLAVDLRELAIPVDAIRVADADGVIVELRPGESPTPAPPAPPLAE